MAVAAQHRATPSAVGWRLRAVVGQRQLIAATNSLERCVIAVDGDRATSAIPCVAAVPGGVVVAVLVVAGPHCHAPNGGINNHLCGRGKNRRGDCDTSSRQQTKQNGAHEYLSGFCDMRK